MADSHALVNGIDLICDRYRRRTDRDGLFQEIYEQIRGNWLRNREPDRWPSYKNWVLRVAPQFTPDSNHRFEKQLQKQIAVCLENDGWGNDVPTASGLVDAHARQMNIDLAHRIEHGFEFVELKLQSDTPYDAALQILRYGALYLLYRMEPELARRFKSHAMICARRIVLEVLAPLRYYSETNLDLRCLEMQLHRQVETFAEERCSTPLALSFRFMAFAPDFMYRPGMDSESIRNAVRHRISAFKK